MKAKNVYRGHPVERVGHGKKAVFQTTLNEKEWSTTTESLLKAAIDAWIDQGVEPEA
jgi:hypothetical protein